MKIERFVWVGRGNTELNVDIESLEVNLGVQISKAGRFHELSLFQHQQNLQEVRCMRRVTNN